MIRSRDIDNGRFEFSLKQSFGIIALYFIGYMVVLQVVGLILTDTLFGVKNAIHPTIMLIGLMILLFLSFFLVRKPVMDSWRFFLRAKKSNIKKVFQNFGFLLLFTFGCNIFFMVVLGDRSPENQEAVVDGIKAAPALYAFMTVIFAPLVEEFVFRGVLYQKFRSKKSFLSAVVISMLIFGLIHVLPAYLVSGDLSEFLFIIQYSGLAFFMIRCFEETSSIWGSISIHFLNNALGFLLIFLS